MTRTMKARAKKRAPKKRRPTTEQLVERLLTAISGVVGSVNGAADAVRAQTQHFADDRDRADKLARLDKRIALLRDAALLLWDLKEATERSDIRQRAAKAYSEMFSVLTVVEAERTHAALRVDGPQ